MPDLKLSPINRDRYIGFDGRYEGPENRSEPKKTLGSDASVTPSPAFVNAPHIPLPDRQAAWKRISEERRLDSLFLLLSNRNYHSRKYCGDSPLLREIETENLKTTQRTPFDELEKWLDPSEFVNGGVQIKTPRRPERKAPIWAMDDEKLKLLVRHLRYDKRGVHKGFTIERAVYFLYLYYRCRMSSGEIAGCVGTSQETVESVIKRVTARGNKLFTTLQGHLELHVVTEEESGSVTPEIFEHWVAEYSTGLNRRVSSH